MSNLLAANTSLIASILTAPRAAFVSLQARPRALVPFLLVLFSSAAIIFWYYGAVDLEWLRDYVLSASPQFAELPEDARERARNALTQNTLRWSSLIAAVIFFAIMLSLTALFYMLASAVLGVGASFKRWLALVCWSSMPLVLGFLLTAAMLLLSDMPLQVSIDSLQPLSMNELLFQRQPSESAYTMLVSLTVFDLWAWGLRVVGVQTWTGRSWQFSTLFALAPFLLVYGIWGMLVLLP